jgi:hypothetical protein
MDNFDRFGDSYTDFLDVRELDEILDCMEGGFEVNDALMDRIGLKRRRAGKVSLCFGVSELNKVKLKMNDNQLVSTFEDDPNSIIVEGHLEPFQLHAIHDYKAINPDVKIESVDDLKAIEIL